MAIQGRLEFDVCILGAGMVGAALACVLANNGMRVALIEPYLPHPFNAQESPDLRVSALNKHSIDLLSSVHALDEIKSMRYRKYDALMVWEDEAAKTQFSAKDVDEPQLGIFAENRVIQLALLKSISGHFAESVTIFNSSASSIDVQQGLVQLASGEHIQAHFIAGADGAQSQVRSVAGIGQVGWDYSQHANLVLVKMKNAIEDMTWQQFTPSGPVALLPMHDDYASLVWYDSAERSSAISNMDNAQLKEAIVKKFPSTLGDFEVCSQAGFGLRRMHTTRYYKHKAVLVGDAAHTINPLAGQGVNLGFKDVTALAQSLQAHSIGELEHAFAAYEKARRGQNLLMMSTMDALYATFSNNNTVLKTVRNFALGAAEKAGPLKNKALKYAMGL
ncbi:FAD-dependent monooxygenase [Glaciecola siphonariae]|uniref:FAD-dependent monooxygenase n=1 Tax=Glaciecola siphonariae TaxID=521012 RepID=A0ABV9LTT6_9ALTE